MAGRLTRSAKGGLKKSSLTRSLNKASVSCVALVCDAVWRLICKYSHPGYVAVSHGPGIVAVMLIGVALVYLWDRRGATH